MPGLDLEVVERAHDLQGAEHAEHAVELAAGRLGVEMAADDDGGERGVLAAAPSEHIAHLVNLDRAARRFAPGWKSSRLCLSRSVKVRRLQPPLGVAPIFAISISESQSRAPLIRTFDKSAI